MFWYGELNGVWFGDGVCKYSLCGLRAGPYDVLKQLARYLTMSRYLVMYLVLKYGYAHALPLGQGDSLCVVHCYKPTFTA